jgi:spore germination cell wall hydrolase CwlJ-like protein
LIQLAGLGALLGLAACGSAPKRASYEQQCLARAMYFESNRSSEEGMLAVGTVVMNRRESGQYPPTICGVVGQKKQFAPGVLSKPMTEPASRERAMAVAAAVMRGKRHRGVGRHAMFFHTAGHRFPYRNMHYVHVAGGNAFYEKRKGTTNDPRRQDRLLAQAARREPGAHRSATTMIAGVRARPAVSRPAHRRVYEPLPEPETAVAYSPAPTPAAEPSIEALIMADAD